MTNPAGPHASDDARISHLALWYMQNVAGPVFGTEDAVERKRAQQRQAGAVFARKIIKDFPGILLRVPDRHALVDTIILNTSDGGARAVIVADAVLALLCSPSYEFLASEEPAETE
jgi:hypothetical protein